jgi:uncharacterized Zn finger protein
MARLRDRYRERWYPPASSPLPAAGGIRAQSRRGAFGRSWWARRWIDALEGMGLGARLARGRAYARSGQVLSVQIQGGCIRARVQGSRPTPYQVRVQVRPLAEEAWAKVGRLLASRAAYAARLLAGEMPADVESVFREAGVGLFPASVAELETECSCPDWSNPCKHIAAVYYLVGEEFDRDPFLLFELRGMSRQGLQALLGTPAARPTPEAGPEPEPPPEPLPADPVAFWSPRTEAALPEVPAAPAQATAVLLRRLGNLPFWRGSRPMVEALEGAYATAAARALALLAGEPPGGAACPAEHGGAATTDEPARRRGSDAGSRRRDGSQDRRPAGNGRPTTALEPGGSTAPRGGKSRDRAALERELLAGRSPDSLRERYDGRTLRAVLRRLGG